MKQETQPSLMFRARTLLSKDLFLYTCVVLFSSFLFFHSVIKYRVESPFIDNAYFYFYSSMARQGLDLFDPASVQKAEERIPIRRAGGLPVYSPTVFMVIAPLTVFSFPVFTTLWLILACGAIFAFIIFVLRRERFVSPLHVAMCFFITLLCQPLHEALFSGQTEWLLVLFSAFAWYAIVKGNHLTAGLWVGAMATLKLHYIALVPALLLMRQWKAFGYAAFFSIVFSSCAIPFFGLHHYADWGRGFFTYGNLEYTNTFLGNIGFNGMTHRFLKGHPQAASLMFLCIIAMLGLPVAFRFLKKPCARPDIDFLICLSMIPLISPLTEIHHFSILLLPLLICANRIGHASQTGRICYVIGLLLIISRYSWNRFADNGHLFFTALLSMQAVGAYFIVLSLLSLRKTAEPDAL